MSSIITFYSYKGGVGRSMAIANISYELSQRGKKVLVVDWDLEAPGIDRYYSHFKMELADSGLLFYLKEIIKNNSIDYKEYLTEINTNFENNIYLFSSGYNFNSSLYIAELESFDWKLFFEQNNGGSVLEKLRNKWLSDFDFILIDSRTGLNEISGICTIFLADVVVALFSANSQNLFGTRDVLENIKTSRQKLEIDRMGLTYLPILSRFGSSSEFKESQKWLDESGEVLGDFFGWLPLWIEPRLILEQLKLPQIEYFSFGEKLAVVEQGTSDPTGLGYVYSKIADLIVSNFTDIPALVGKNLFDKEEANYRRTKAANKILNSKEKPFQYDVFISYPRFSYQWVKETFLPVLTEYLSYELNRSPKIFIDYNESKVSESIENVDNPLNQSKTLILIYSNSEVTSNYLNYEIDLFGTIEKMNKVKLIFPLFINSRDNEISNTNKLPGFESYDFSDSNLEPNKMSNKDTIRFIAKVEAFSKEISSSIKEISSKNLKKLYNPIIIDDNQIRDYVNALSKEYNLIKNIEFNDFTSRSLVTKIKWISRKVDNILKILSTSKDDGEILIAVFALQDKPNYQYADWLVEKASAANVFISTQAAIALYNMTYIISKERKEEFKSKLEKVLNIFQHSTESVKVQSIITAAIKLLIKK